MALAIVVTPSARSLAATRNADPMSLDSITSRYWSFTPNAFAASSSSFITNALLGTFDVPRTATRDSFGTTSRKISNRFPPSSGAKLDSPVIFPPGCARLATTPLATGSLSCAITIGIVDVAPFEARVGAVPPVTMTTGLRATNSRARVGRRSSFPSAKRHSIAMFFPSSYPRSRNPWRNAAILAA